MHTLQGFIFSIVFALSVVIAAAPGFAHAQQKFPSKPVRIVTVGAGSQNDLLARIVSPRMSETWGQPIVIENHTGAGGALAASIVAKATPDGYTNPVNAAFQQRKHAAFTIKMQRADGNKSTSGLELRLHAFGHAYVAFVERRRR